MAPKLGIKRRGVSYTGVWLSLFQQDGTIVFVRVCVTQTRAHVFRVLTEIRVPYRLIPHFFAPKLNIKRRGASCTQYEFTVFLMNLGTRKQDQILGCVENMSVSDLGCVLYMSVSHTRDGTVHRIQSTQRPLSRCGRTTRRTSCAQPSPA